MQDANQLLIAKLLYFGTEFFYIQEIKGVQIHLIINKASHSK